MGTVTRVSATSCPALNGVHLTLRPGETLGIVGESGCGKSTLARALVGLNGTSHGEIHFHGQNIASLRGRARRDFNRRVQMIFRDPYGSLNPRMTVGQILTEALTVHHICPPVEILSGSGRCWNWYAYLLMR